MTILPLVIAPDERLNQRSLKVSQVDDDIRKLCDNMFETMYANKGIGLAAVQVGVMKKVIVIDTEWGSSRYDDEASQDDGKPGNPLVFINAEIIESSDDISSYNEGCLSFPDNYSSVDRPASVTVRYLDRDGKEHTLKADGLLAVCIQHEIDHTNGIVFVDHISRLKRDMIIRRLKKAKKLGTLPLDQPDKVTL